MNTNARASNFIEDDNIPWKEVEEGIHRKVMAYDKRLMLVKVRFEPGKVGALHQHHNSQITQVESGVFEIEINGDKKDPETGRRVLYPSRCDAWGCMYRGGRFDRCVQPDAGGLYLINCRWLCRFGSLV